MPSLPLPPSLLPSLSCGHLALNLLHWLRLFRRGAAATSIGSTFSVDARAAPTRTAPSAPCRRTCRGPAPLPPPRRRKRSRCRSCTGRRHARGAHRCCACILMLMLHARATRRRSTLSTPGRCSRPTARTTTRLSWRARPSATSSTWLPPPPRAPPPRGLSKIIKCNFKSTIYGNGFLLYIFNYNILLCSYT